MKDHTGVDTQRIWLLWYVDRKNVEHFCGSFPNAEEAEEHWRDGLSDMKRKGRYRVESLDPRSLQRK
jgi:hypothetical protein